MHVHTHTDSDTAMNVGVNAQQDAAKHLNNAHPSRLRRAQGDVA